MRYINLRFTYLLTWDSLAIEQCPGLLKATFFQMVPKRTFGGELRVKACCEEFRLRSILWRLRNTPKPYPVSNNNLVTEMSMFMVLSSWHSHCKSSPDHLVNADQRQAFNWTKPIGSYSVYINHRHLLLLSSKADTHFTVPRRVEDWVCLAGWLHTETVYLSADSHPSTVSQKRDLCASVHNSVKY